MSSSVVIDAVVNIQAGQLNDFSKNLRKAAQDSINGIDYTRMERGFKNVGDKLSRLISDAVDHDLKFDFKGVYDLQKKYVATMKDGAAKVARYEAALKKDNLRKEVREALQARLTATKQVMKAEQDIIDKRLKAEKDIQDATKEHLAMMKKGVGEIAKEMGTGFDNAVSNFWSNLKSGNVADIFKNMSGGSSKMGKSMGRWAKAQQGKGGEMGGMAKNAAKLSKVLMKLGAVVGVVAGVVAAFGMIVKVMLDANSQQKEFNRLILDGVGGAQMLAGTIRNDVGASLQNMTKWATSFAFATQTTAKDLLGVINAFQQAGYTAKEMVSNMEDAASATQGYSVAAQHALTYSRLLGMSATEAATQMTESMEDLNQTLDGVAKRFSSVTRYAMESGFGVKRFFSMVLQATSGMSMYNVRLEEAAGLLVRIGRILGSKVGGDFLSQLGKGFVDESMQDRMKRVMLTGRGRTQNAFELSAQDTSRAFGSMVGDLVRSGGVSSQDMFRGTGLADFDFSKLNGTANERAAAQEQLGNLTRGLNDQEMSDILSRVRLNVGSLGNDGDAMVRSLENMISVQRGASGSFNDMVTNLDALDMGGTLNMLLGSGAGLFGGKQLHELSAMQLAAIENSTNLSGEQLQQMREMSRAMHGNWNEAQRIARATEKTAEAQDFSRLGLEQTQHTAGMSKADVEALGRYMAQEGITSQEAQRMLSDPASAARLRHSASESDMVRQTRAMGGFIDDMGKFRAAVVNENGEVEYDRNAAGIDPADSASYQAYIQSQGDAMGAEMAHRQMSLDESLQQEISDNTYDIKTILEQGTNWILQGISTMVGGIWSWISGGAADNKINTLEELNEIQRSFQQTAGELRQEIRMKQREKRQAGSPEEAARIQSEIDSLERRRETDLIQSEIHREAQVRVRTAKKGSPLADGFSDSWMPWNPDYDPAASRAEALELAMEDPEGRLMQRLVDIAPKTVGDPYRAALANSQDQMPEIDKRIQQAERMSENLRLSTELRSGGHFFNPTDEWMEQNPGMTTADGWAYTAEKDLDPSIVREGGTSAEMLPRLGAGALYDQFLSLMGQNMAEVGDEERKTSTNTFLSSEMGQAGMSLGAAREAFFRNTGITGVSGGTEYEGLNSAFQTQFAWMPQVADIVNPASFDAQREALAFQIRNDANTNPQGNRQKVVTHNADGTVDTELSDEVMQGVAGVGSPYLTDEKSEAHGIQYLPSNVPQRNIQVASHRFGRHHASGDEAVNPRDTSAVTRQQAEQAGTEAGRRQGLRTFAVQDALANPNRTDLQTFQGAMGLDPSTNKPPEEIEQTAEEAARSNELAEQIHALMAVGQDNTEGLLSLLNDDEQTRYQQGLVVDNRARAEHERFLSGEFVDALLRAQEENGTGGLTSRSSRGVMNSLATAFEGSSNFDVAAGRTGANSDGTSKALTMEKLREQLTGPASGIDDEFINWLNTRINGTARWQLFNIPQMLFEGGGNTGIVSRLQDFIAVPGANGSASIYEPTPGDTYRMDENGIVIGSKSGGPFSQLGRGGAGGNNGGRIIHEWRITSQQDADALYRTAMRLLALQQRRG